MHAEDWESQTPCSAQSRRGVSGPWDHYRSQNQKWVTQLTEQPRGPYLLLFFFVISTPKVGLELMNPRLRDQVSQVTQIFPI